MLVKATFKKVVEIRPFKTRDGQDRFTVVYLIASNFNKRDGSTGVNVLLVEVVYDQQPQLQVGDINDPDIYEFEIYFRVNQSQKDASRYFMKALCSKVSKTIA